MQLALTFLALVLFPLVQQSSDVSKREVELPLERALPGGAASQVPDREPVKPGFVRWHADFATACAAAESSYKPVLLFQLLGKLDDEFC